MRMFSTQDVINMGVKLYDDEGFTRENIKMWLTILVDSGLADVNVEEMFDIIVGWGGKWYEGI